jgi:hypothetical protein
MSDLDLLRSLGDQIVPPPFDDLRETARRRNHRTATATAVVVAAAVAIAIGAVQLEVIEHRSAPPVDVPKVDTSRPLTYAEGATLHVGEQSVTMLSEVVEIDLTDDGVVARTSDGGIWFTAGSDPVQIGTLGEPGARFDPTELPGFVEPGYGFGTANGFAVSGNSGSLVAWWEFPEPDRPELVVYDTAARKETARQPIEIAAGRSALLASVTERFAYWYVDPEWINLDVPSARIDLDTGEQARITPDEYTADVPPPGTPRTILVGSDENGGGGPYQVREGLIAGLLQLGMDARAHSIDPAGPGDLVALDGATRTPFAFTAPPGFRDPDPPPGWLTQWIDDDTIVIAFRGEKSSDLLVCDVSTGACDLAAQSVEAVLPEIG